MEVFHLRASWGRCRQRECSKFEEGLNNEVKLSFGKVVELVILGQDYCLNSVQERMDSMKSWAGIEEEKECLFCDAECESVSHVLWDCPAYSSIRSAFMLELRRELGDRFEHFQSLESFAKSSFVLGSEAWEEYSSGLLS